MPFSNILPTTQLVLPDGGSQTPGSGTTVIGGPLPAELTAGGYTGSGIIWYSKDSGYKYEFLVNSGTNSFEGYVDNNGVIQNTKVLGDDGLALLGNTAIVALSVAAPIGGTNIINLRNNGTDSYLTDNSKHVDTPIPINGSVTLGGQTCVYAINYVISYDRVCNVSVKLTWAIATTVGGNLGLPSVMPVAARPRITTTYQTGLYVTGSNVTGMSQMNYDIAGGIALIQVPTGTTAVITSFTYLVAKPTF